MEPVTHILTGACLARTGLNRRAAYTTLAMAVAAELPDIDTLWGLRGPITGFEHHRGITHTFLGIPLEAALVVAGIYGFHRWRAVRAARRTRPTAATRDGHVPLHRPLTLAPARWGLLYFFALLALLSHLFLDYTNNYGLRPFFPFNPRWYAASITFIFDPLMFAVLLAALLFPAIFRLISSEVASGSKNHRQVFASRGWAITGLLGVVALWTLRMVEHNQAVTLAMAQSIAAPAAPSASPEPTATPGVTPGTDATVAPTAAVRVFLQPQRVLASPDLVNPFRWYTVSDFGPFYQLATADTRNAAIVPAQTMQPKLEPSPALLSAESSVLGRVYLDWSPMPFLTLDHPFPGDRVENEDSAATVVTFRDPRFMGDIPLLNRDGRTPLTGTVELDASDHVMFQTWDDKVQRR